MSKYANFELSEFITSETAQKKGIDNTPTFEIVDHLNELIGGILQPLRDAWGSGLHINSGYRSKELNKVLSSSSPTSVHMLGYAADITPSNGKFDDFLKFCEKWLKVDCRVSFDQMLIEKNSKGARWVHIGLKNNEGQQRRQIKTMEVK